MVSRLKNSPILEAICEIHLQPDIKWDLTTPGIIYEHIKNEFPKRRKATGIIQRPIVQQVSSKQSALSSPQIQVTAYEIVQCFSEDEKFVFQISPNVLSINRLQPYSTWEEFEPVILKCWKAYNQIAEKTEIRLITLRYLNNIELPGDRIELEEYLDFRPYIGPRLIQDHGQFNVGVSWPFENMRDMLKIQLNMVNPRKMGILSFMLELQYMLVVPNIIQTEPQFQEWLNLAHDRIKESFLACLNSKLEILLGKVEQ